VALAAEACLGFPRGVRKGSDDNDDEYGYTDAYESNWDLTGV